MWWDLSVSEKKDVKGFLETTTSTSFVVLSSQSEEKKKTNAVGLV